MKGCWQHNASQQIEFLPTIAILFYESAFSKNLHIYDILEHGEKQTARPKNNIRWNIALFPAIIIINFLAFTNSDKQNFDFHSSLLSGTR